MEGKEERGWGKEANRKGKWKEEEMKDRWKWKE